MSDPLDHDDNGRKGGAKKPETPVWVVTRADGLHQVAASQMDTALKADGGRLATDRDLAIAGVERDA